MSEQHSASDPATGRRAPGSRGERRIITVLFCDVVGSTAMAEKLDPEEWAEVMNEAFEYLTAPVTRYEGTVARLMGDGLMAFFGAPVSHEDDPRRAVLAGLDIVSGIAEFREGLRRDYGMDFNVRVGINTGPVVVGDVGSAAMTEYTAMGDAVNLASRMEQSAEPGTVQVSADTARLIERHFELESLGGVEVKGKTEPVETFRVVGARHGAVEMASASASAPLVGRNAELGLLQDAAEALAEGRGGVVCIIGEAGLGKSRLIQELKRAWEPERVDRGWEFGEGLPYDTARPYSLFQNLARSTFGIGLEDPAEVIHQKIESALRTKDSPEEAVALCSVTFERVIAAKVLHDPAQNYSAETIKQDLFDVAYPAWLGATGTVPTVLVLDDLQWSDEASIELLLHIIRSVEEVPLLFVCAFRPERQSPAWKVKQFCETEIPHRYTEISLRPLDAEDTDALVSTLLHIQDVLPEVRSLILRKTEGNPYFVEEVVRTLIEQGAVHESDGGLHWSEDTDVNQISIPDTLQALLMARMDRLDTDTRAVLQAAAVIGRSFYHRILGAIAESTMALDKNLLSLERVELIREQERLPELEYIFKHELTRDAAYGSILHRRRRQLHRQVGEAMESLLSDKLEENAHRIAYHFSEAGDDTRALTYFEMAAQAAEGLDAKAEAVVHYRHALEAAERSGAAADEIQRLNGRLQELAAV